MADNRDDLEGRSATTGDCSGCRNDDRPPRGQLLAGRRTITLTIKIAGKTGFHDEIRTEIRDFRQATTASFNAMREDLTDGFIEMRGKLDAAAAGQQQITTLLNTLIDQQNDQ